MYLGKAYLIQSIGLSGQALERSLDEKMEKVRIAGGFVVYRAERLPLTPFNTGAAALKHFELKRS